MKLASDKLTACRQRIQQAACGRRDRAGDEPPYRGRPTLLTRRSLPTERQKDRLTRISSEPEEPFVLEITYLLYQDIIDAYQHPKPVVGTKMMTNIIDKPRRKGSGGVQGRPELGLTLHRKRAAILAFFDRDGASNGPVEAVNGRLEHPRGIALRFLNSTN